MNFKENLNFFFKNCIEGLESKNITISIGNESCDLDSFISSLVIALHENAIFVVNMSKDIFKAKGDLMMICSQYSIDLDTLIFLERPFGDFSSEARKVGTFLSVGHKKFYIKQKNIKLILTDHNSPVEELDNCQVDLIIDHHPITEKTPSARRIYIDTDIGSCSTLVSKFVGHSLVSTSFCKNTKFENEFFCRSLARLLIIPIVIDTSNFKRRTSHFDYGEFKKLKKKSNFSMKEIKEMRKKLKKAKINDKDIETTVILQKDYKKFSCSGIAFGYATVKYNLKDWANREMKKNSSKTASVLESQFMKFCRDQGLNFLLVNYKKKKERNLMMMNCIFEKEIANENDFEGKNYKGLVFYSIPVRLTRKIMVPIIMKKIGKSPFIINKEENKKFNK